MRRSLRMRALLPLLAGLVAGMTVAGLATGCLSIEQDACQAGETLCVDGSVWACTDDGSGWIEEARCPQGRCESGRCLLEPPPAFDVSVPDEDAGGGGEDAAGPDAAGPDAAGPDAATGDSAAGDGAAVSEAGDDDGSD